MDPGLRRAIDKIGEESLRKKVLEMLEKSSIEIDGRTFKGLSLVKTPAGIYHHHGYPGGLVEHIISATRIALALCDSVEKVYHGKIDRDIVVAGIVLHDLFKTFSYEERRDQTYGFSPLGERVDHLSLVVSEMTRRGLPLDLIHAVCAHHGEAGPIRPMTAEALICHLADLMDSKLNGEVIKAARYLVKDATGEVWERITTREAFDIVHSKKVGGWDQLREKVEKLRKP